MSKDKMKEIVCPCGSKKGFDKEEVFRVTTGSPEHSEKISYKTCVTCGRKVEVVMKEE